ncbi:Dyp-type peroxidase domain-containing protein, partial [Streptomyces microflavus]
MEGALRQASKCPGGRFFPGDRLDPGSCHGDLSVQVCAQHPDAILHVV